MKWIGRIGCAALILVAAAAGYIAWNDQGVVTVRYDDSKLASHRIIKMQLRSNHHFEVAAAGIDTAFLIPRDIQVVFADCGKANATYDPAQAAVFVCYELLRLFAQDYRKYAPTDSAADVALWQTALFVFYHEMGHALIDILGLPATGREEDAVDQLATILLLEAGPDGRDAALRGAEWLQLQSRRSTGRSRAWDEHSLDQQRYFNVICWVYGSDPKAQAALLGRDWGLPRARAARCPPEYARIHRAWTSLLRTHRY